MAENRAFVKIMARLEEELDGVVRTGNRVHTEAEGCSSRAVAATAANETRVLLTIGVYAGAVCAAVWVSLNLLHWFWRQLQ